MPYPLTRSGPPEGGWPPPRHWPRLAAMAVRAVAELARARWRFGRLCARDIRSRNRSAAGGRRARGEADWQRIAWIGFVLPRVARRVPWRSDCLVQALAGQQWLASHGIASEIRIGVEKPTAEEFAAHAWLACGDQIVTGGRTDRYTVLL